MDTVDPKSKLYEICSQLSEFSGTTEAREELAAILAQLNVWGNKHIITG